MVSHDSVSHEAEESLLVAGSIGAEVVGAVDVDDRVVSAVVEEFDTEVDGGGLVGAALGEPVPGETLAEVVGTTTGEEPIGEAAGESSRDASHPTASATVNPRTPDFCIGR